MAFWVAKNRANGRHYHEGRYWTYNTLEALSKLFPFWSRRQLERIINGLKEAGALLAGNFSEDRTDRTRWYALADCILEVYGESEPPISRNGEMHFTGRGQPFHETVKCNKETVTYQIDPPKPQKGAGGEVQSWMGQSSPCWRSTLPETRSWPSLGCPDGDPGGRKRRWTPPGRDRTSRSTG